VGLIELEDVTARDLARPTRMTLHDLGPPTGPATPHAPHRFLPVLLVLFFGSGCAALIYEVVWLQLLQLVIGSTAVSIGVLLWGHSGVQRTGRLEKYQRKHRFSDYLLLLLYRFV
jgi:hypothetical protein